MKTTDYYISNSAAETYALAERLGRVLPPGTVIASSGDLGAGKTVFAAGLAQGMGVPDVVTSPTYIFFNDYEGRIPFCHIDAYRLENLNSDDLAQVGLDDCFDRHKAVFVEWADFIGEWLPQDTIRLEISRTVDQEDTRILSFTYDKLEQRWLHEALGN